MKTEQLLTEIREIIDAHSSIVNTAENAFKKGVISDRDFAERCLDSCKTRDERIAQTVIYWESLQPAEV